MHILDNVSSPRKPPWITPLSGLHLPRLHSELYPDACCTLVTHLSCLSAPFVLISWEAVLCLTLSSSSVHIIALSIQLVPNKCLHNSKWMSRSKEERDDMRERGKERRKIQRPFKISWWLIDLLIHFMQHFKILKFCHFLLCGSQMLLSFYLYT